MRADLKALAALAAGVLIFFSPLLLGRVLYCEDFIPFYHLRMPLWVMGRMGRLMFWCPCEFAGSPMLGDFQRALLYPGSLCYYLLPPGLSTSVHTILHFVWAAWGMYLLARLRDLSRPASTLAAVAYTWSFWMIYHSGGVPLVAATSWVPWVLCTLLMVVRRGWGWMGPLGWAVGMLCLCGYPQVLQLTLAVLGALGLLWGPRLGWRRSGQIILAVLLGGLLSSAQTLPAVYGTALTLRSRGVSSFVSSSYNLTPAMAWSAFSPYCRGITGANPGQEPGPMFRLWRGLVGGQGEDEVYRGDWTLQEMCVYPGLVVWMLALVALRARRREVYLLWAAVVAAYWAALGERGGLFWLWTHLVPLAGLFRGPVRVAMVASLALALLAGRGLDSLGERRPWLPALGVLLLWLLAPRPLMVCYLSPLVLLLAAALLPRARAWVPLLLFMDLACLGQGYLRTDARVEPPVPAPVLTRLAQLAGSQRVALGTDPSIPGKVALWSTAFGLSSLQGWNPVVMGRFIELLYYSESGAFPDQEARDRLVAQNYLFILSQPAAPLMRLLGTRFVLGAGGKILENPQALPRCWLTSHAMVVEDGQANLQLVRTGQVDPARTILFSQACPGSADQEEPAGTVDSLKEGWDWVEAQCTLDHPGFLATNLIYEKGWRVEVDGQRRPLLRAFHALAGLPLEAGTHRVVFSYLPPLLMPGLGLSTLSLVALGALTWYGLRRGGIS